MWKLLNVEKGDLATRDTETAEALNTSCSLVFTEDLPLATPDPEISGKAWSKQALPLSEKKNKLGNIETNWTYTEYLEPNSMQP